LLRIISDLSQIIRRTVNNVENASVLCIGPRGSGKSETVVSTLRKHYTADKMKIVYLQGAFFPREHLVLSELLYQLAKKDSDDDVDAAAADEEDEEAAINEQQQKQVDEDDEEEDDQGNTKMDDFVIKSLETLAAALRSSSPDSKSQRCNVIVLDDFEIIAKHAKKTVYHLLDATHLKNVNTLVIGITRSTVCKQCLLNLFKVTLKI